MSDEVPAAPAPVPADDTPADDRIFQTVTTMRALLDEAHAKGAPNIPDLHLHLNSIVLDVRELAQDARDAVRDKEQAEIDAEQDEVDAAEARGDLEELRAVVADVGRMFERLLRIAADPGPPAAVLDWHGLVLDARQWLRDNHEGYVS